MVTLRPTSPFVPSADALSCPTAQSSNTLSSPRLLPTSITDSRIWPLSPGLGAGPNGRHTNEFLNGETKLPAHEVEALDQWFDNLQKYEATLEEMATASVDAKFKEELSTIEQWFRLLTEAERTATVYSLLHQSSQIQIPFYIAVLQQMARYDSVNALVASVESQGRSKYTHRTLRPPSLNLPPPNPVSAPCLNTPSTSSFESAQPSALEPRSNSQPKQGPSSQEIFDDRNLTPGADSSWASMVNTPLDTMFRKEHGSVAKSTGGSSDGVTEQDGKNVPSSLSGLAGFSSINPYDVNLFSAMGLSTEAQLLAVKMVVSGIVQPGRRGSQRPHSQQKQQSRQQRSASGNNWRSPGNDKYPASALRSSALKSSSVKSSGLKSGSLNSSGLSSGLSSASSTDSPREEEWDPELLKDIPAWLKHLRLHKYTASFDGMTWQDMVALNESELEAKGIVTLGARRRLLRSFDNVRKRMEMDADGPSSALPLNILSTDNVSSASESVDSITPTSAFPVNVGALLAVES